MADSQTDRRYTSAAEVLGRAQPDGPGLPPAGASSATFDAPPAAEPYRPGPR